MTKTTLGVIDRTRTYESGGTFVQWADATNAKIIAFASAWNMTTSMDEFDIDRIDSAAPIFTPITDIVGTFSFNLKNLVSLFDAAKPPTDPLLISKWIQDIKAGKPPSITFAPVMEAPEATGSKFLNFIFTGRVMNVPIDQVLDQGVQDLVISGEITAIDQVRREATANEEG